MNFKHFIITRFNIPLWRTQEKDPVNNLSYLNYRMDLFEAFCFPSLVQQTNQNFLWLCLFDIHTPAEVQARIQKLQMKYKKFIPLYLDVDAFKEIPSAIMERRRQYDMINSRIYVTEVKRDDKEYVERVQRLVTPAFLQESIRIYTSSDDEWILTTRLDNDDSLHKTFVDEVQKRYMDNPGEYVLNFLYGYQYFVDDNIVFRNRFENNHFTTLAEKNDRNLVTILFYNHLLLSHHKYVVNVENEQPVFAELLHGGNVCNSLTLDKDLNVCYRHPDMKDFSPSMPRNFFIRIIWTLLHKYSGVWFYIVKNKIIS